MERQQAETILNFFPARGEVTLASAFQAELRGIKASLERCGLIVEVGYSRMHVAHPAHFDRPVMFPGLTVRSGTLPPAAGEFLRAFYSAKPGRSIILARDKPYLRIEADTQMKLESLCLALQP